MKKNKCEICGWEGKRTQIHHIIPSRNYGENSQNNLIELCPNCHAESYGKEKEFALKHNLIGERYSDFKIRNLCRGSLLWHKFKIIHHLNEREIFEFSLITKIYCFNESDYFSYLMGITKSRAEELIENYNIKSLKV